MRCIACSFCGSSLDEVDELYPGTNAHICTRCILDFHQEVRATRGVRSCVRGLRERVQQEVNFLRNRLRYWKHRHRTLSPIFILCMQRTGSSLLFDYLSSIPDSCFSFEMLNHEMSHGIKRGSPRVKVLNHIMISTYALGTSVCGAKFFLDQLRTHCVGLADFTRLFPSAKFLVLYRENLAEQYVSLEIARRTNTWFYYGNNPDYTETLHVDLEGLLYFVQDCREKYADIIEHPLFAEHGLAISYESIVEDFAGLMEKELAGFLELPPWDFDSELQKRNKRPLHEIIENYNELAAVLESDGVRLYID